MEFFFFQLSDIKFINSMLCYLAITPKSMISSYMFEYNFFKRKFFSLSFLYAIDETRIKAD